MSRCVDQGSLETDTHADTHSEQLICQADIPSWRPSSPVEETRWGEGLVFVVNGSLSAGGPLPAPYMHTCDISHQHLLSPLQALQACDCASHCIAECGSRDSQKVTQASQASQTQGLWACRQDWVVGLWVVTPTTPSSQPFRHSAVTLRLLLAPLRL